MTRLGTWGLLLAGLALLMTGVARADMSFKHRGDNERRFAARAGEAVVLAAHYTAKDITLKDYKVTHPKDNRTNLHITMGWKGALSGRFSKKTYTSNITVQCDSTNPDAWEVLRIDYSDDLKFPPWNAKKVQGKVREFNR